MKRLVLAILITGVLLLGGCSSPTTPITTTTPIKSPEPAIPAHFTTYTDKSGLFSISYPLKWELGLSLIEGNTIFIAGKPYQDGYNPSVSILLLPYKQALLLLYQPTDESTWKLEDFVETKVQEEIKFSKEYHESSRTKIVVGGREAIVLDSESTVFGMHLRGLKMYLRDDKLVWEVICGVMPSNNFSDFEADFHAIVRSLHILK